MNIKKYVTALFLSLMLVSCGEGDKKTATNVTPEEKQAAIKNLKEAINKQFNLYKDVKDENAADTTKKEINFAENGDDVEITYPAGIKSIGDLKIKYPEFTAKASIAEVPNLWNIEYNFPNKDIQITNAKEERADIAIASQTHEGVLDTDVGFYPKFTSNIDSISIKADDLNGKIASIETSTDYKKNDQNTWSGKQEYAASDLVFNPKSKDGVEKELTIESIKASGDMQGADIKELMKITENMQKNMTANTFNESDVKNSFINQLKSFGNGMTGNFIVSDLNYTEEENSVKVDTINMNTDYQKNDKGMSKAGGKLSFEGLKVNLPEVDKQSQLFPENAVISISVDKLPIDEMIKSAEEIEKNSTKETAAFAPSPYEEKMKELMKTHKTSFNINELSWNAPLHKLAADLKAQFAENPMSIEGITNVKISGFSKIRDYAKENKESNMQDILNGLAMIEMFGQTDPSDPDTRTYKIEIDKAGTLKMNGAPFPMDQMMMGGGAGGAMPPQPQ